MCEVMNKSLLRKSRCSVELGSSAERTESSGQIVRSLLSWERVLSCQESEQPIKEPKRKELSHYHLL